MAKEEIKKTYHQPKVKLSKYDKITYDGAIEILRGAYALGIRIDAANKVQKWPIDRLVTSAKVIAAGKVLDKSNIDKDKTGWKTEWYHTANEIPKH